jgi:hypothetical protein
MMMDHKSAGPLMVEGIVALIILAMFIVIRPKPRPPAPQHPLPSRDPVRLKMSTGDPDVYSS